MTEQYLPPDVVKQVSRLLAGRGRLCFDALHHLDGYTGSGFNCESGRYGFMAGNPAIRSLIIPVLFPVAVYPKIRLDSWDLPETAMIEQKESIISLEEFQHLCGDDFTKFLTAHQWSAVTVIMEEEQGHQKLFIYNTGGGYSDSPDAETVHLAIWDLFELQFNRVERIVVHEEDGDKPE
jgi:hypothetical protein